jgi:hypothetical protein
MFFSTFSEITQILLSKYNGMNLLAKDEMGCFYAACILNLVIIADERKI